MEMRQCKPVLRRILSVYEQLSRKETPERFGCAKKLSSICVFKDVHVLPLKQPIAWREVDGFDGFKFKFEADNLSYFCDFSSVLVVT